MSSTPRIIVTPDARNHLAAIWLAADPGQRQRLTDAAREIEKMILADPTSGFELFPSKNYYLRWAPTSPLVAHYKIDSATSTITIFGFSMGIKPLPGS